MGKCEICGGTGEVPCGDCTEGQVLEGTCSNCGGSGQTPLVDGGSEPCLSPKCHGGKVWIAHWACNGTGTRRHGVCGGTGQFPPP
jgi:hypothetical protein